MYERYAVRGGGGTTLHVVSYIDRDGELRLLCARENDAEVRWTEHVPEDGSRLCNRCSQLLSQREDFAELETNHVYNNLGRKARPLEVTWPNSRNLYGD